MYGNNIGVYYMAEKIITIADGRTVTLHNSRIIRGREIYGCLFDDDIAFLIKAVQDLGVYPKILEIGTFEGLSTFTMWKASDYTAQIVCIDDYIVEWSNKSFHIFRESLELTGAGNNIHLFLGSSKNVLPFLQEREFDLIFIDGGHEYKEVISDITMCLPLIKRGGIMCGHDFDERSEHGRELVMAVHELLGEVQIQGVCWYKEM
jgi:predicted O-methyltransferase YrrM